MRTGWMWVVVMAGCGQIDAPTEQIARRHDPGHAPHSRHRPHPPRPPRPCKHVDDGHGHGAAKHELVTCTTIGSDGGTVAVPGGPTLDFPPGALTADTEIGVAIASAAAPHGALSQRYEFTPSGLVFTEPVALSIPVQPGTTDASLYWSKYHGGGFDRLAATVSGGALHGTIVHFSDGYAGPPSGPDLLINVTLATIHYVNGGVSNPPTYPAIADYAPALYLADGSLYTATPAFTSIGNGVYSTTLPAGTTSYTLGVTDPTYGPLYYAATGNVDIGTDAGGRSDATVVPLPTTAAIHLTAVGRTAPGADEVFAASESAGMQWLDLEGSFVGDEVDLALPDSNNTHVLLAATDDLEITELTPATTSGGLDYLAQTASATTSVAQAASGPTPVSVNLLADLAQTAAFTFAASDFNLPRALDFDGTSTYRAVSPTALATGVSVWFAQPGCAPLPGGCAQTSLPFDLDSTVALDFNAPATAMGASVTYDIGCRAAIDVPTIGTAHVACDADGEADPGSPIQAVVGPVKDVTLDGATWTSELVAATGSPLISWSPPIVGTPGHYLVAVFDVTSAPAKSVVAWIATTTTSVVVPAGVVAPGHHYFVRINSEVESNLQRFRTQLPAGRARWVSPTFRR